MSQTEEELTHARKLASIEARREAFNKSPFWFTAWDLLTKLIDIGATLLNVLFWVAFYGGHCAVHLQRLHLARRSLMICDALKVIFLVNASLAVSFGIFIQSVKLCNAFHISPLFAAVACVCAYALWLRQLVRDA